MTPRTKNAVMSAVVALLAILAVAGWTRDPSAANVGANHFASGVWDPSRATYGQQPGYVPMAQQPAYSTPGPVQPGGYAPAGMMNNCVEPEYTNAAYAPGPQYTSNSPRYRTINRPRVVRTNYVERDRDVVVRAKRGRSTAKSAAIVAGSAGAGAAIGALAGGGKGAAIGAVSGGTAGFIFDRLTHNR